ncbi:hypothetical protein H0H93_014574 [Arthromyces matolae]|nr:hypothetical protein H0H93_014574 [Arthromyces matolae]
MIIPNIDIRVNAEPALLSRTTSEEIPDTRPLVTVPKEFLQVPPESDPVMMRVPRALEYTSLRSVLRILNLMNVAVDQCDALKGPRDTFQEELQKLPWVTSRINQNRFPESKEENLEVLDLETLKQRITNAVESQKVFQGEITIAGAFFPSGQRIGLKVPYPDNADAVQSVKTILYLLHSGISREQAKNLVPLCSQMKVRLKTDFKLDLGDRQRHRILSLTPGEREAFERQFIRVVGLHNNNEWISRDINIQGEMINNRYSIFCSTYLHVESCSGRINIPLIFVPANLSPKHVSLRIPSKNDESGVASANRILQLMAMVAGPETTAKNIAYFHERLTRVFGMKNIVYPVKWGKDAMTKEERAHKKSLLVTEIKKHNDAVGKWSEESYKNVCKGIGGGKRKADGPLEQDGTWPATRQKQQGRQSMEYRAGERLSNDNRVRPGMGTTGSHLEGPMARMSPVAKHGPPEPIALRKNDQTSPTQQGGQSRGETAGQRLSLDDEIRQGTGTTGSHLEGLMAPMAPGTSSRPSHITLPRIRTAFREQFDGTIHPGQLEGTNHRPTLPGILTAPLNNQRGNPETSS